MVFLDLRVSIEVLITCKLVMVLIVGLPQVCTIKMCSKQPQTKPRINGSGTVLARW